VTVILAAKEAQGSGHVAIVAPAEMIQSGSWGEMVPQVFNIGKQNKLFGANYGFSKKNQPTAFILKADKKSADARMKKNSNQSAWWKDKQEGFWAIVKEWFENLDLAIEAASAGN
jgi:hypothetical protein